MPRKVTLYMEYRGAAFAYMRRSLAGYVTLLVIPDGGFSAEKITK